MKIGRFKVKTKKLIKGGILSSVVIILVSLFLGGLQDKYEIDISNFRKQKNEHFKTSEASPIENKINFKELNYFPPSKNYKVDAKLLTDKDSSFIIIKTNDGQTSKYKVFAKAVFKVDKKVDTLTLYKKMQADKMENIYFVPFTDDTNGDESYIGGRYLDLKIIDTSKVIIDFNLAYNPYCVYNYRYSCPIPPSANKINFRIPAGEKMYSKK